MRLRRRPILCGTVLLSVACVCWGCGTTPQRRDDGTVPEPITDTTIADARHDGAMMASGSSLFAARCSPCHGAQGQGSIGPNLTDDAWLHGGRPMQIYRSISEGAPAKGMIAWKSRLAPRQLLALTAYVMTLEESSPPHPKAPQGDRVERGDGAPGAPASTSR